MSPVWVLPARFTRVGTEYLLSGYTVCPLPQVSTPVVTSDLVLAIQVAQIEILGST
jgi:hypothetical protein